MSKLNSFDKIKKQSIKIIVNKIILGTETKMFNLKYHKPTKDATCFLTEQQIFEYKDAFSICKFNYI